MNAFGKLAGYALTEDHDLIYTADPGGALHEIAKDGDVIDGVTLTLPGRVAMINDSGQVVFWARAPAGPGHGIYRYDPLSTPAVSTIVYDGDAAPDPGTTFTTFSERAIDIDNYGRITFAAAIVGTAGYGVYRYDPCTEGIIELVQAGAVIPDHAPETIGVILRLSANDNGDVAFVSEIGGATLLRYTEGAPDCDCNGNGIDDACDFDLCDGDANCDNTVDSLDLGFILARFGCAVGTGDCFCDRADVNGDGLVDPLDSGYSLARFGPCR